MVMISSDYTLLKFIKVLTIEKAINKKIRDVSYLLGMCFVQNKV